MGKVKPKNFRLNLYGWTPNRSFGFSVPVPLLKTTLSERQLPKDLFMLGQGKDYSFGLNIVYRRRRHEVHSNPTATNNSK